MVHWPLQHLLSVNRIWNKVVLLALGRKSSLSEINGHYPTRDINKPSYFRPNGSTYHNFKQIGKKKTPTRIRVNQKHLTFLRTLEKYFVNYKLTKRWLSDQKHIKGIFCWVMVNMLILQAILHMILFFIRFSNNLVLD